MSRYLYNPPGIIKTVFGDWNWVTVNNKILFTFDDGPIPETTPLILSALEKYNIKAIFFCVGNNINRHPELAANILARGHMIGNHTYNHKIITRIGKEEALDEINSFIDVSKEKLGYIPGYFRPPHGRFNFGTKKLLKSLNQKAVLWSLLTFDYKNDFDMVKFAVTKYLRSNSIIVLHDSLKSKDIILKSIDFIVEQAAKKGYDIGEPQECLK